MQEDKDIRFDEVFKKIKGSLPKNKDFTPRKESVNFSSALNRSEEDLNEKEAKLIYNELLSLVERFYNLNSLEYKKEDLDKLKEIIQRIINFSSHKNFESILCLCIKDYDTEEKYLYNHVVNVVILTIFMGKEINYSEETLRELGICSFLHDLGMLKVLQIINQKRRLSSLEYSQVKEHPNITATYLQAIPYDLSPTIYQAVRQEHERFDGSGYPLGLKGEEISEYARLIGLIDVYEALIHTRPYRKKFNPLEAIQEILNKKEAFDNNILRVFISHFGVFPPGAKVRLNTQEIGLVIKRNPLLPLRPVVKIVLDKYNKPLTQPKEIDLSVNPNLYIEECLSE